MKKISLLAGLGLGLITPAVGKDVSESGSAEVTFVSARKSVHAQVTPVSGPLLPPLGTQPLLGRDFIAQDFEKQSPAVAIISSSLWAAATGSRPDVIGQKIKINDRDYLVIAVAPKSPAPLEGQKVWTGSP